MKVCVASPYDLSEPKGNSVTTRRVVDILRENGIEARGTFGYEGEPADVLIALHAVKGAPAIEHFKKIHPEGKVIILITGTDLYQDLPEGSAAGERALESADAIVVVFEEALGSLDPRWRHKAVVVPSSLAPIDQVACPEIPPFAISVVGHLRPVKRSFLTIETVTRHPEWEVEVWQLGAALDRESEKTAREWEGRDPRYRWFGGLPREESLARCAKSALTVNSSLLECGPNAVLEAMTMGVPILASRIEGNIGLLGQDYPGYFEGKMDGILAEILAGREATDRWVEFAAARVPLFSRERETRCWLDLLDKLFYSPISS